ncbi:hypothetical protein ASA1KI_09180 [Opitutales bacterium ASA1]|jgi:hypothetical protein|uniref:hypothetical protein n=1 Tax=Congregicoccus parvus TaxID=3081749 RepID=UPI002B295B9F|nr:hypothetical protein ASA1KI_09180 [Opitutales bacterium ASA1]
MIHSNVGFKDVILEALPDGHFRLKDPASSQQLCPFSFANRKAARNWANGRGLRVIENTTPGSAAFPRPL